jgi:hypothetical protein
VNPHPALCVQVRCFLSLHTWWLLGSMHCIKKMWACICSVFMPPFKPLIEWHLTDLCLSAQAPSCDWWDEAVLLLNSSNKTLTMRMSQMHNHCSSLQWPWAQPFLDFNWRLYSVVLVRIITFRENYKVNEKYS